MAIVEWRAGNDTTEIFAVAAASELCSALRAALLVDVTKTLQQAIDATHQQDWRRDE